MALETDSLYQRLGDIELPVQPGSIGAPGLAALDPQRDILLELFAAAINAELGPAWEKVYMQWGMRALGSLPVSDKLPDEPTEQLLTQRKCKFPLLAVHRSGTGVYEDLSLEITRLRQPWIIHYILGPLDAIDARQLKDVCVAVAKIVALVIQRRGHRAYQGGALQFFGDNAPNEPSPFTGIKLVSHEGPGQAAFGGDNNTTLYWAIELRLETTEISSYVEGADSTELDAADFTIGVGGGEGLLPGMIVAKTDPEGL